MINIIYKYDYIGHFLLCFLVTLVFGWRIGLTVGLTIEFTQAEYDCFNVRAFFKRITSQDTIKDLIFDGFGIVLAFYIRGLL